MAEPKKLSPMMQKKLAEQAKAATSPVPETKTATETALPKPAPVATPAKTETPKASSPVAKSVAVAKPIASREMSPSVKPMTTGKYEKNPNGERYGYGDGLASTFGAPPAIDEAYDVVNTVSKIPATIFDGAITFFKKVIS